MARALRLFRPNSGGRVHDSQHRRGRTAPHARVPADEWAGRPDDHHQPSRGRPLHPGSHRAGLAPREWCRTVWTRSCYKAVLVGTRDRLRQSLGLDGEFVWLAWWGGSKMAAEQLSQHAPARSSARVRAERSRCRPSPGRTRGCSRPRRKPCPARWVSNGAVRFVGDPEVTRPWSKFMTEADGYPHVLDMGRDADGPARGERRGSRYCRDSGRRQRGRWCRKG